ncbi:uncharacterized protein B4U79_10386, partial [Dinothrombium tinctorium]
NKVAFRVTTVLNPPFTKVKDGMELKENDSDLNEKLDGYAIDLLRELASESGFEFNLQLSKDSAYGSNFNNGSWNGMIGEVYRGEADLALADLTITSKRQEVVDFSFPFMETGVTLLIKRPPYYLHGKNSSRPPLLLYTVASVDDLPDQNEIEYGVVRGGSTFYFFKESDHPKFRKIGEYLVKHSQEMPRSNREGVERVKNANGTYAFFMESAALDYIVGKECDVMQLGKRVNSRYYGIAMPKNFEFKTMINTGLANLHERGLLQNLKEKWFPKPSKCEYKAIQPVYMRSALNLIMYDVQMREKHESQI